MTSNAVSTRRLGFIIATVAISLLPIRSFGQGLVSVYQFTSHVSGHPVGNVIEANDGAFFGITSPAWFGTNTVSDGWTSPGSVYRLSPKGVLTTLHTFTGADDGGLPVYGVVDGRDGWLYGITQQGGAENAGTFYRVSITGTFQKLHDFGPNDSPFNAPNFILATDGNFYGVTEFGNLVRMTRTGVFTTIASIGTNGVVQLTQGADGNLYANGERIALDGTVTPLEVFSFSSSPPPIQMLPTEDGSFYGFNGSQIYKLSGDGLGSNVAGPFTGFITAALAKGPDGNLYFPYFDTSQVKVLLEEVTPEGATLVASSFTGNLGGSIISGLVQGVDGKMYGTSFNGGIDGNGFIYSYTTSLRAASSYNPSYPGQSTSLNVSIDGCCPPATGTVTISDGRVQIGSITLQNGHGSTSLTFPAVFSMHALALSYGGDTTHSPVSTVYSQQVSSGNGHNVLILQNAADRRVAIVHMAGAAPDQFSVVDKGLPSGYSVAGYGDFDNNGDPDLLLQNKAGDLQIWLMNGGKYLSTVALPSAGKGWTVVGVSDLTGSVGYGFPYGQPDILLQNTSTGDMQIWYMNGTSVSSMTPLPISPSIDPSQLSVADYEAIGVGDTFGGGFPNILVRNKTTGALQSWFVFDNVIDGPLFINPKQPDPGWNVVSVVSLFGHENPDFVLQNGSRVKVWEMSDCYTAREQHLFVPQGWTIVGPK